MTTILNTVCRPRPTRQEIHARADALDRRAQHYIRVAGRLRNLGMESRATHFEKAADDLWVNEAQLRAAATTAPKGPP